MLDSAQPAWVMQSPAGPQLIRAFQSYAAVSFLAIAFWKLGLAIASTPTRALNEFGIDSAIEGVLIGGGVILLAPLHCLLICFVVSAPAFSSIEAALFCDDQQGEGR